MQIDFVHINPSRILPVFRVKLSVENQCVLYPSAVSFVTFHDYIFQIILARKLRFLNLPELRTVSVVLHLWIFHTNLQLTCEF